jgi:hypothetical protein
VSGLAAGNIKGATSAEGAETGKAVFRIRALLNALNAAGHNKKKSPEVERKRISPAY